MAVHFPWFSNFSGSIVSEAVAILNGAHFGLNTKLGSLLSQYRSWKEKEQKHNVSSITSSSVCNELNIEYNSLLSSLQEPPLSSHDCMTVNDIIKSCGVGKLRNPYNLLLPNRQYSTLPRYNNSTLNKHTRSRWRHDLLTGSRRYLSDYHIMQLESRANSEVDDPSVQYQYLMAVCERDPEYVVRRFESGRYAIDEDVRSVYQRALSLIQRNKSRGGSSNDEFTKTLGSIFGDSSFSTSATTPSGTGHKDSPIHVIVQPRKGGIIREIWYFARFVILAFVITTFVSSAVFTQMKGGSQQMTKDFRPDMSDKEYTFNDVQGIDEAKAEVQEVVEFLKNPSRFKKLGAKLPTGMLLIGAPGTGKTLLAKAIAGEADVPFFFASGSEFDEMFVGVGASRVRKLFEQARRNKPCVIFIDELDAVGGARVSSAIHPYSRMTLNQLLVELDGYKELEGVVVIGATNFPESLDKALIRPGRFDSQIHISMPDVKARQQILNVHAKKIKLSSEVNLETVARKTIGFTGADLANLINQAALRASSEGKTEVTQSDVEYANEKIVMGPEKRSLVIEQKNKELVAFHEGGHAIVAMYTPGALSIHKATIVPRGPALGMVSLLPEKDELSWSKKQLLAKMDVAMGGRVAEEMIFGSENVTTGASSDFQHATNIATAMVTKYGMSDAVGPMVHADKTSSATQKIIEDEIKKLLKESYERAHNILKTHSLEHKRLAEGLLKYETLDFEEIKLIIAAKPLNRPSS